MIDQLTNKHTYVGWMPVSRITHDYGTAIPFSGAQKNTNSPYSLDRDSTSKIPIKRGYQLRTAEQPTIFIEMNSPGVRTDTSGYKIVKPL